MAQLIDDLVLDASAGVHRPRNLDWKRAAALLYGDWGTSKAYVIGLAFLAAGFSSLPIILAVCALTGLVGINYIVICRHFPDGGGVYSAARSQGRLLAVVGALLLLADLTRLDGNPRVSQFFVRLMVPRVRDQRGTQFPKRIGANDARHREHLVAPARQLTSSATLKGKGGRGINRLLLK